MDIFDIFSDIETPKPVEPIVVNDIHLDNKVILKSDYKDGKYSQHEYYTQFVTEKILALVVSKIGLEAIKEIKSKSMSEIPDSTFDSLAGSLYLIRNKDALKVVGEDMDTMFFYIKIAKAAIKLYKESHELR